ncbi:DMT family transporter [Aureispira sp. CCB-E]|uniref:DMT family transporter n=1 Tax=Aureispira sp. CCB-E TaxID=3051121 RepID=UPI002868AA22|nr:DMT family transporter [Aureispira sp. CCB-E]WMX16700.1 DMT family transporter [Aureispira sp. CCB-E]
MNQYLLSLLALIGGAFLALQGSLNAQLGLLLKNPLLASLIAFCSSTCFAFCLVLLTTKHYPNAIIIREVPIYLWFAGGLFSLIGISLYYYTIPKLGLSTMISFGLCGQLVFAVIAGHFGWFGLPTEPMSLQRLGGLVAMIVGILLINLK